MLRLKRRDSTPPGGFSYVDADTNFPFRANCFGDLFEKVKEHRRANKLPIVEILAAQIEDWLCRRMPDGVCVSDTPSPMRTGHNRVIVEGIMNATIRTFKASRPTDQATANKRAAVCALCVRNIRTPGCNSCRGINSIIKGMIGPKSTPLDSKLNTCDFCGMALRVIVHCATVVPASKTTVTTKPIQCWIGG